MNDGTYPMYVCDTCAFGHYHPLSYCPKCPGKLHRANVPHPPVFASEDHRAEHLAAHGIKYIGEYPKVSEEEKRRISIQRAEASLALRISEGDAAFAAGDRKTAEGAYRAAAFWKREIERYDDGYYA